MVDFRRAQKQYMQQKMRQHEIRMKNTTAYIDEEKAANDISEDLILELVGSVW